MIVLSGSVIGCEHWGKNLVRNFHQLGALHSVCDVTEQCWLTVRSIALVASTCDHWELLLDKIERLWLPLVSKDAFRARCGPGRRAGAAGHRVRSHRDGANQFCLDKVQS